MSNIGSVSMKQVADLARVSVGTVSNAINRPDRVSAPTAARIRAAIDELGFVRNEHARQLKGAKSSTIGMVVLSLSNPFFANLAEACEAAAESRGLTLVVGSSDQKPEREERYADLFEEQRVRGLLLAPLRGVTDRVLRVRERGTPLVVFGPYSASSDFCSIALDGEQGSFLAATHLLELGRRAIWFVGGPLHQIADRWMGTQRAVAHYPDARLDHVDTVDQTENEGYRIGHMITQLPEGSRPRAICAANDLIALGIMNALRAAPEIRIPEDIAIIGYDDIDQSRRAHIPLSTVRQPIDSIAIAAVDLLRDEERSPQHAHRHVLLVPELVVRDSSRVSETSG